MFKTQRSSSNFWSRFQYNCNIYSWLCLKKDAQEDRAAIIYLVRFKYLPVELVHPAVFGTWQYPSPPWQVLAWPHSANPTFRRKSDQQSPSVWHLVSCLPTFCTPIIAITPCQHVNVHSSWCSSKLDLHLCAWHNILSKQFPPPCPDPNPIHPDNNSFFMKKGDLSSKMMVFITLIHTN